MNIKTVFLLATLMVTNLLLVGCVALYKPTAVHSPLLKEKGEARVSGSIGMLGTGLYNLQGAYAPKEHVGILLDGMYHYESTNEDTENPEKTNILYGEVGGGYFSTFGEKEQGLFQCYGGVGMGKSNHVIRSAEPSEPQASTNYATVFVQPGVAYVRRNFDAAVDVRSNLVHLYNTQAYLMDRFEFWNTQNSFVSDTTLNFMLIEPTLTLRFGPERFKGFVQLGLTLPAWNSDNYMDVFGTSVLFGQFFKFTIGLTYLLPTK